MSSRPSPRVSVSAFCILNSASRNVSSMRLHIDRIQRLTCGHEEPVAARAAEAYVRTGLGQPNHPDALAVRRDHLHPGPRAGPDVAIGVAANAVGGRWGAGARNIELYETFAIAHRRAVDVIHLDVSRHPSVGDVQLLVVGREADAVGLADFVGDLCNLPGLPIDTVDRFLRFLLPFVALVLTADAVDRIGEPDAAIRVHDDVVWRIELLPLVFVRNRRN